MLSKESGGYYRLGPVWFLPGSVNSVNLVLISLLSVQWFRLLLNSTVSPVDCDHERYISIDFKMQIYLSGCMHSIQNECHDFIYILPITYLDWFLPFPSISWQQLILWSFASLQNAYENRSICTHETNREQPKDFYEIWYWGYNRTAIKVTSYENLHSFLWAVPLSNLRYHCYYC
jgi:hypothetical protein